MDVPTPQPRTPGQPIAIWLEGLLMGLLVPKARVGTVYGILFKAPLLFLRLGLSGLIPDHVLVLTTKGRRTGAPRRTPMEYTAGPREGTYFVMSGWGGRTDWYRNARADPHVQVWLRGREWAALAEPVPHEEVARRMMEVTRVNPSFTRIWSRWSSAPIDGSEGSYLAAAPNFPSLCLAPTGPEAGQDFR